MKFQELILLNLSLDSSTSRGNSSSASITSRLLRWNGYDAVTFCSLILSKILSTKEIRHLEVNLPDNQRRGLKFIRRENFQLSPLT
jgi:hypothetical protein